MQIIVRTVDNDEVVTDYNVTNFKEAEARASKQDEPFLGVIVYCTEQEGKTLPPCFKLWKVPDGYTFVQGENGVYMYYYVIRRGVQGIAGT